MVVKVKKKHFQLFYPVASVWVLSNRTQDTPLRQVFMSSLYLFNSYFLRICFDKLHDFEERICSPTNGSRGNSENAPFQQRFLRRKNAIKT